MKAKLSLKHPKQFVQSLSFYYKKDWLEWTPEIYQATLIDQFGLDFSGDDGALQIEKSEALRELLRSDTSLNNIVAFENVIHALNETHFTHGVWEPCGPEEIVYGLYLMERIRGKVGDNMSEAVQSYVATCLVDAGVLHGPDELRLDLFQEKIKALSELSQQLRDKIEGAFEKAWASSKPVSFDGVLASAKKQIDSMRASPGVGSENLSEDDLMVAQTLTKLVRILGYLEKKGVRLSEDFN